MSVKKKRSKKTTNRRRAASEEVANKPEPDIQATEEVGADKCHPNKEAHEPRSPSDSVESSADPFDPAKLRLSQDFASSLGVKKAMLTVPVRKPAKEWWIRVHPEEEYRLQTAVLELKEEGEIYLVARSLWPDLATSESTFSPRAFFTTMNRQGVVFLWPVRLPGEDGKLDDWNKSALEAAEMAQQTWVRVAANRNLGAYDVWEAQADIPDPRWPDVTFQELLKVAFKDRYIDDHDHPVLKVLRGEA